jgi:hypothetical protein
VDSPGSGYASLAGCCECGDEPSGSGPTELVSTLLIVYDAPSAAVFVGNLLHSFIVSIFFSPLATIPLTPVITGMT